MGSKGQRAFQRQQGRADQADRGGNRGGVRSPNAGGGPGIPNSPLHGSVDDKDKIEVQITEAEADRMGRFHAQLAYFGAEVRRAEAEAQLANEVAAREEVRLVEYRRKIAEKYGCQDFIGVDFNTGRATGIKPPPAPEPEISAKKEPPEATAVDEAAIADVIAASEERINNQERPANGA